MDGTSEGFAVRQAIARLAMLASAALCPLGAPAASVTANLSVSVVVTRQCGIRLEPDAQPRPLCRPGAGAPLSPDRNAQLQYDGATDPVSIVRRPGGRDAPDVWVITF